MARKKSNTTLVREYIRELIVSKGLKPGDMLPCEGEIAASLEISKSCVREGIRALESIGLIEVKHGIGLILRDFNLDAIGDIFDYGFVLDPNIVLDLYDLRRQLESSLMPRVIRGMDDKRLSQCEKILEEWREQVEKGKPVHSLDCRFHETLYAAVGNRMMTSLCRIFWNTFYDLERRQLLLSETPPDNLESARKTLEAHRGILAAVRQGDSVLASQRMYDHFAKLNARP